VFVPVAAPLFLLRKGHDIVVPEGTRVDTFVDGDHLVSTEGETAVMTAAAAAVAPSGSMPLPPLPPAAPAAAPERTAPLTNADIIALRQAGFGDDLILAKVAASPAAYTLTPAEMVALKKAGVSERVITAMVAAK